MAYPDTLKTWVRKQNRQDLVIAEDVNTVYDEVEAVVRQLGQGGVVTSGPWAGATALDKTTTVWGSLKLRLQNIENGLAIAHDKRVSTTGGSTVVPASAATTGVVITGASSQTADLFRVESSTGTQFIKVSGTGAVTITIDGGTA